MTQVPIVRARETEELGIAEGEVTTNIQKEIRGQRLMLRLQ